MMLRSPLSLCLLAVAAPLYAAAEEPARGPESPRPPAEPVTRERRGQMEAVIHLHRLLSMSDEQLARSRQLIEKVEKLSPAERESLRTRLNEMRHATPEQREAFAAELRGRLGVSGEEVRMKEPGKPAKPGEPKPPEGGPRGPVRNLLDKHFATMPPDQAKAEREKFLALPREEKIAYLSALREKYGLGPKPDGKPGSPDRPRGPEGDAPPPPAKSGDEPPSQPAS